MNTDPTPEKAIRDLLVRAWHHAIQQDHLSDETLGQLWVRLQQLDADLERAVLNQQAMSFSERLRALEALTRAELAVLLGGGAFV
ncbi:hypothetical protein [Deinococcus pimensis]|uniref:hypothetical protein n=1 Tax=Deinococcus pimensis TaxID=309888 RepID=UPI0004824D02|nr:hypothetical protein [Deinococcus pimensis]